MSTYEERSVYVLIDSSTEQAFYVGVSTDPYQRFIAHLQCRGNNEAKNEYIAGLKQRNLVPAMHILHCSYGTEETHAKIEAHYIDLFRKNGQPLTNQHLRIGFTFDQHEQAMVEHGVVGMFTFSFIPDAKYAQDWQDYLKLCADAGVADPTLSDNKWRWRHFLIDRAVYAAMKQERDEEWARIKQQWAERERRIFPWFLTALFLLGSIWSVGSALHGEVAPLGAFVSVLLLGIRLLAWYVIQAKRQEVGAVLAALVRERQEA